MNRRIMRKMDRRTKAHLIPMGAMIVLTDRCHLRCQQCYLVANPRPELSTEEICRAIDQLVEAGTFFVTFTGGEPLLRPDIYELIRYATQRGIIVTLFSTATSCNPSRVQKLVEAGLTRLSTSLYSAEPSYHDAITQIPGSFEKTLAGIQELQKANVRVEVKYLQMNTNVGQLTPTRALVERLGADFALDFGMIACHDGRRDPLAYQTQEETIFQLQLQLALDDPDGLGHIEPNPEQMDKPMCGAGRNRAVVGTDGKIYSCQRLNVPMGDLQQQSFDEIWQGEEAQRIRNLKKFSDPRCRVCPDRRFCNFCPGQALLNNGDPTSPNATICMTARVRRRVYEAIQSQQVEALSRPLPPSTLPSSGCQQCSSGLQDKIDVLLEQPSIFSADERSLPKREKERRVEEMRPSSPRAT